MKLPNIRLSVCPFIGPVIWLQHAAVAGLLLWDVDRLLHGWHSAANASSVTSSPDIFIRN